MRIETSGGTWHVRRRWAPRHLGPDTAFGRFRNRAREIRKKTRSDDIPDPGCLVDLAEAVSIVFAAALFALFLIFFGLPFLIALGELLFVLLLATAGVVGRVLFRRPWTIDAVSPDGAHTMWEVVGWRASGAARDFVAERLRHAGEVPSLAQVQAATLTP